MNLWTSAPVAKRQKYKIRPVLVNGLPFRSATAAAREIGVSPRAIVAALNKGRTHVAGYSVREPE